MRSPILTLLRSALRRLRFSALYVSVGIAAFVAVSTVLAVMALWQLVDGPALRSVIDNALTDPIGLAIAVGGFGSAFAIRSVAWSRLLPALSFGQAWAAIHVALGANHVLPLRLGEPLRIVSATRRTDVPVKAATASGVALRLGDIVALLVIAAALGPSQLLDLLGWAGGAIAAAITVAALVAVVIALRISNDTVGLDRLDALTAALTFFAWGAEALLVQRVAQWGGIDVSYREALLVTVIAIAAQLVAIAPGGVGTYEAAATGALLFVGAPPEQALAVAVAAHLLKTAYSIAIGGVAMFLPSPNIFGPLRLPKTLPDIEHEPIGEGPVALFMPAYNEEGRVSEVIERAPSTCLGRPLVVAVIDDGSADGTVAEAKASGARVFELGANYGLGRAVAEGFKRCIDDLGAAVVVFCDADGEYGPEEIDNLVAPIMEGTADYVIGSRFAGNIEHMRPHRRLGNVTLSRWVRWMTRQPVTDGQSGYRALTAQAARTTVMAHDYNYAQVLTIDLLQRGFRYAEVPINYHFRESGDSFVKLPRYLRTVVPTVLRQLRNPPEVDADSSALAANDDVINLDQPTSAGIGGANDRLAGGV